MKEKKTNGLAIASFVLSLCGVLTLGVSTLVGFILGIIALGRIKENGEKGEGLAITAVVLGALLIMFFVIGLIAGIFAQ